MKRRLTKEELSNYIKRLDTRATKLTPEQIDDVILSSFGELSTFGFPFSSENIVDLTQYITAGEDVLAVDIDKDVIDIFDYYLTIDTIDEQYEEFHGTKIYRETDDVAKNSDKSVLYRDGFDPGRVHVRLDKAPVGTKTLVMKFYYNPDENFTDLFVDAQSNLAIQYAVGVSLYDVLHDVERSSQKRAGLERVTKAIANNYPESYEQTKESMFPRGI